MSLRAEVDESACISSGKCVADAPGAFRFDEEEISEAIDGASALDDRTLLAIARNCPASAIRVFDGDTTVAVD
jgi:ferredoxin